MLDTPTGVQALTAGLYLHSEVAKHEQPCMLELNQVLTKQQQDEAGCTDSIWSRKDMSFQMCHAVHLAFTPSGF